MNKIIDFLEWSFIALGVTIGLFALLTAIIIVLVLISKYAIFIFDKIM
jgi:hypothetical protein